MALIQVNEIFQYTQQECHLVVLLTRSFMGISQGFHRALSMINVSLTIIYIYTICRD